MPCETAIGCNVRKSPFFDATVADGVRSFSIYNQVYAPSHFGDPGGEYQALLSNVVLWDVSCERQVQLAGPDAERLARYLSTREIGGMAVGPGKYLPLCNYQGNLINDPVLQKLADDWFWLSIADSDILLWAQAIAAERGLNAQVTEREVSLGLTVVGTVTEAVYSPRLMRNIAVGMLSTEIPDDSDGYRVAEPDKLPTPAMLVFRDHLHHNIRSVCEVAHGGRNLFTHVKTHKSEAVRPRGSTSTSPTGRGSRSSPI